MNTTFEPTPGLSPQQRTVFQAEIKSLLNQHIASPYETLRERGPVAQLFCALRGRAHFDEVVNAELQPHRGKRKQPPVETVPVGRVQLEVTVRCTKGQCPVEKAFDLIAFRDEPTVFYGGQGRGDVLQQVEASSVAAAVEVKASPSGDMAAGGEYAKDIFALLWLATEYQAATFFVLLDKSSPRFRANATPGSGLPTGDWMTGQVLVRNGRVMMAAGEDAAQRTSLSELGIALSPRPPAEPLPYVEVWTIQPGGAGQPWAPQVHYATLQPQGRNRHITVAEAKARARALLTEQGKQSA